MNPRRRHAKRSMPTLIAGLALIVAACGPAIPTATPTATPTAIPTATPSATATASTTPTAEASPTPTPSPSAPPSAATACAVIPQTGVLPSDRFIDLQLASGATSDRLTFVFGDPSLPGPTAGTAPKGSLAVARPPYTHAASGARIAMVGAHVLQIRFSNVAVQNDAGEETYAGPPEFKPAFPALRHAVLYDASEGIVGWYIGYDGPGCVTLARVGSAVTVTIAHS
jgi:hypothetical protein